MISCSEILPGWLGKELRVVSLIKDITAYTLAILEIYKKNFKLYFIFYFQSTQF